MPQSSAKYFILHLSIETVSSQSLTRPASSLVLETSREKSRTAHLIGPQMGAGVRAVIVRRLLLANLRRPGVKISVAGFWIAHFSFGFQSQVCPFQRRSCFKSRSPCVQNNRPYTPSELFFAKNEAFAAMIIFNETLSLFYNKT